MTNKLAAIERERQAELESLRQRVRELEKDVYEYGRYLDRIARYMINEAMVNTDDMKDSEVATFVICAFDALRNRCNGIQAVVDAARDFIEKSPSDYDITKEQEKAYFKYLDALSALEKEK